MSILDLFFLLKRSTIGIGILYKYDIFIEYTNLTSSVIDWKDPEIKISKISEKKKNTAKLKKLTNINSI